MSTHPTVPWRSLATATCALVLSACASTVPANDKHFGESVRSLTAQQTLNPSASAQNEGRVLGGDGRMVQGGLERAVDSYRNGQGAGGLSLNAIGLGASAGTGK